LTGPREEAHRYIPILHILRLWVMEEALEKSKTACVDRKENKEIREVQDGTSNKNADDRHYATDLTGLHGNDGLSAGTTRSCGEDPNMS